MRVSVCIIIYPFVSFYSSRSSSGVWTKSEGDLNGGHRFCEVNLFFDGADHSPSLGEKYQRKKRTSP